LIVDVWYPAEPGSTNSGQQFARRSQSVARDAACHRDGIRVDPGGDAPWVIFSPDAMQRADAYSSLALALVDAGSLFVAVHHRGESSLYGDETAEAWRSLDAEKRNTELRRAIEALHSDPTLGPCIKGRPGIAMGHGLGAHTALTLVGAEPNLNALSEYCSSVFTKGDLSCRVTLKLDGERRRELLSPVRCEDLREPRIGGAWLLEPSHVPSFSPETLAAIETPTGISAVSRASLPHQAHAGYLARHLPKLLRDERDAKSASATQAVAATETATPSAWLDACGDQLQGSDDCAERPGLTDPKQLSALIRRVQRLVPR
jgi:predicted dienelactone hydrolase